VTAPPLIVIFGASVCADGTPSAALRRRIGYGAAAAAAFPEARMLCSGGADGSGPTEAAVMVEHLRGLGISASRLMVDAASLDTLQNVAAAARSVKALGAGTVVACSDGYHLPRVRLLLAVLGVRSVSGPRPGPRGDLLYRVGMALREVVAIPYDVALAVMHRRRLLS